MADAGVGVDANDEDIAFAARSFKVADVAGVQRVKTPVRENDAAAVASVIGEEFAKLFTPDDFGSGGAHRSGGGAARFAADGREQIFAGNRGRAALHDHKSAGNVSDVRGFERGGATRKPQGERSENGVSRAGNVNGLIAAVHGNVREAVARLEKGHAVAATRNEERSQLHFRERRTATAGKFFQILADSSLVKGFEFGFVGCGGGNSRFRVGVQLIARVERDRQLAFALRSGLTDEIRSGHAETIVGNRERVRGTQFREKRLLQLPAGALRKRRLRLTVNAQHLLPDGVRPAGKEARFRGSRPAFHAMNPGNIDAPSAKIGDEGVACRVVADSADGVDASTQCGEIVGGICATAGNELRFAMTKNEHGSFAGDARDFAKLKFVGDEIAEQNYGFRRELLDTLGESHKIHRKRSRTFHALTLHFGCLRTQSTASVRVCATWSGCIGHFAACQASSPSP